MSKNMKIGDTFTIEGCGRGAKGQPVIGGINPNTGRKCRAVTLTVFACIASTRSARNAKGKRP